MSKLDNFPDVKRIFNSPLGQLVLDDMWIQISRYCKCRHTGLSEWIVSFPSDEVLDILQVYENPKRFFISDILTQLCSDIMSVLDVYSLLDYQMLDHFHKCYFVGHDLILKQ